ncbi:transporter substrate-binding domain-containing protein [Pseudoalteromonas xiamenensis]|uniref:substrate-binding periplasmic protein n=1 Tax=Pseudoalteromonas xiamenensis TaxID=882626 RepID=UPI0027E3F8A7|nr:transporter substrate-binding domain-containing protein [Pseudoalteromonas xiamenensis]WMN58684.1 transporter substrate-binding domain-containing protein [Pseudoalteromonas xiamenensis]
MNTCLRLWFALCLSFFMLAAQAKNTLQNSIEPILQRGELRIAMYQHDTPPFYFTQDNTLTGLDVELMQGFANHLGIPARFLRQARTLNEAIQMVEEGKADIAICKLSITFNRAQKVLFTKPYIRLRKALLINRVLLQKQQGKRSKYEAIQTLEGKLAVIGNSSYEDYAKQRFVHMEIVPYPTWQDAVNAVRQQQVVAAFRDEVEIKKVIVDNNNDAVNVMTVVLDNDFDNKGIAVSREAGYLKYLLELYMDNLNLELTANRVLFDYPKLIEHIHRNQLKED